MFSTPDEIILNLMAVMLRVGMQGAALRADIPKAKFVRQISVPQLMDTPDLYIVQMFTFLLHQKTDRHSDIVF